jgi:hypothetical protein
MLVKFSEIAVGVAGLALSLISSAVSAYLFTLETADVQEFPFIAPWAAVSVAVVSVAPGVFIGWFAVHRALIVGSVVGFAAGIIETSKLWAGVVSSHYLEASSMPGPGIDDYLASGTANAVYLCASTALGVILRMRVAR